MAKQYDLQQFRFKTADGRDVLINAWRYETRNSWGHKACLVYVGGTYIGLEKRITYYNRTWESFTYETMLHKIIREFFTGKKNLDRDCILKQVQAIADHESEACERFCKAFQSAYNGLTDAQKQRLADADIHITNEEQAQTALKLVQAMALLNA